MRYTDYKDFGQPSLKISIELPEEGMPEEIVGRAGYDWARFSDGNRYKFSQRDATKEKAIDRITAQYPPNARNALRFSAADQRSGGGQQNLFAFGTRQSGK